MTWEELFQRPKDFVADEWFARIAATLLNASRLIVAGEPHRLTEVELYYHGPAHEDPFAHRDPVQQQVGVWYFHRTGGTYRGGSFKGLDLAFGSPGVFSGLLFRGLEDSAGRFVDGPSLLVDHILKKTGAKSVRELDAGIADRVAWDASSPVHLMRLPEPESRPIYRAARVGLTLKRATLGDPRPQFLRKDYRFLTEPRHTKKGKAHIVRGLHQQGVPIERIRELTGSPLASIRRYLTLAAGTPPTLR
ncbi:hypothetical protein [Limnoglobus roseus]|uniref:Uncharacterized protein n=1 Tax=Limnoglobus roseus TaxID=2598579 RepID=A0A5C1A8T7_9BACT|nr:hypothetical protein [Limnoglobus roseus]QEL14697.1 hypothetical protein PX52LOC_01590 [Limnoglobus roseus]